MPNQAAVNSKTIVYRTSDTLAEIAVQRGQRLGQLLINAMGTVATTDPSAGSTESMADASDANGAVLTALFYASDAELLERVKAYARQG